MKKIYLFSIIAASALALCSCEKFFDREPENKFAADLFFRSQTDLEYYTNGLIDAALPSVESVTIGNDAFSDFCATKNSKSFFIPGQFSASDGTGWSASNWSFLRQVAYMLDNMKNAEKNVKPEIYKHYEGVARFFRALSTYNKVRTFGDCFWIDHVISPNDSSILYGPRQDREYIMHQVVLDLKAAVDQCLASGDKIRTDGCIYINKYCALALASRICLFEGTYRKYHSENPSTGKPWNNKYETSENLIQLAFNYSKQLVESGAFKLGTDYRALFTSEKLNKDEIIWGRSCSTLLEVAHNSSYRYNNANENRWGATKDYVMMFLQSDGKPVPSGEISVTEEFNNRDKRLSATILAPGMKKKDATGISVNYCPDFLCTETGYQWIKWVVAEDAPMTSGGIAKSYNGAGYLRYAEVLLNYAEAAAELGCMDESIWNATIKELRVKHGGLSNAPYPGAAGYVADNWLRKYYSTNVVHTFNYSDVLLEIRRERATELTFEEASRYNDLMRWNLGDLIVRRYNNQGWRGIYLTQADVEKGFDFNGAHYTVSSTKKDDNRNYNISSGSSDNTHILTGGNQGYLVYNLKLGWEEKLYLNPIPVTAINVNPNLCQNNGWQWL